MIKCVVDSDEQLWGDKIAEMTNELEKALSACKGVKVSACFGINSYMLVIAYSWMQKLLKLTWTVNMQIIWQQWLHVLTF